MLTRPQDTEYAPFHADYVARVPDGSVLSILTEQVSSFREILSHVAEEAASRPRHEGEWTIKQVLGHLSDSERVLGYRALRFSRADRTDLAGFEQDDYVREGGANSRGIADLLSEFEHLRLSNVALFANMTDEAAMRTGVANGATVSVRALAYIMAGHAARHLELLKSRFLVST